MSEEQSRPNTPLNAPGTRHQTDTPAPSSGLRTFEGRDRQFESVQHNLQFSGPSTQNNVSNLYSPNVWPPPLNAWPLQMGSQPYQQPGYTHFNDLHDVPIYTLGHDMGHRDITSAWPPGSTSMWDPANHGVVFPEGMNQCIDELLGDDEENQQQESINVAPHRSVQTCQFDVQPSTSKDEPTSGYDGKCMSFKNDDIQYNADRESQINRGGNKKVFKRENCHTDGTIDNAVEQHNSRDQQFETSLREELKKDDKPSNTKEKGNQDRSSRYDGTLKVETKAWRHSVYPTITDKLMQTASDDHKESSDMPSEQGNELIQNPRDAMDADNSQPTETESGRKRRGEAKSGRTPKKRVTWADPESTATESQVSEEDAHARVLKEYMLLLRGHRSGKKS